ncbi:hypothetical protein CCM_07433 [Cordyceps militaris CM01]|uniref:Uncharacterized protein n=1 Tax=Cordyceps militaris (strain CM01) TaxID=983644 RepID=G3JPT0_CORMM|nr:uncharacterized protein CCM_07433 [Cordyceps militaris CM01]EGX89181.1 hypothetical protein CCM_07433 [Cordyceps militaris CM01]
MSSLLTDTKSAKRNSDPKSPVVHSIRSSSLRNSPSTRSKSLSPRKRTTNQPLHIRMNLTETQMDKITDAFASKLNASHMSPAKTHLIDKSNEPSAQNQPRRAEPGFEPPEQLKPHETMNIVSPTISELMPRSKDESLAKRRQKAMPAQIDVFTQHRSTSKPQRPQMEHVETAVSPLSANIATKNDAQKRPPSSSRGLELQPPRPLNIPSNRRSQQREHGEDGMIDVYNDWTQIYRSGVSPLSPEPIRSPGSEIHHPRRSKSLAEGIRRQRSPAKTSLNPESERQAYYPPDMVSESPLFSPLPLYFRGQDFPTVKQGGKTLIGNNGWLEKTGQDLGQNGENKMPQKRTGIFDSLRKIAKDMSLLYCELEYHLTSALNSYISQELEKGRLVPINFQKIADAWYQQGRPRVVGFRFDLETQVDLVALHVNEFTFCGRRQCNPVEISSLLHTMKVNARAMRVRTFCQPDSVIAKQLADSQSLFDMIGAANDAIRALSEILHFFKVIVEREQNVLQQRQKEQKRTTGLPSRAIYQ